MQGRLASKLASSGDYAKHYTLLSTGHVLAAVIVSI